MNEYTVIIFAAAAMASFSGFAFYNGKNESLMRTAVGLIFICALISPAVSLIRGFSEVDFSSEGVSGENIYEKTAEEAYSSGVELALAEEFSFSEGEVLVRIIGFSAESMSCERLVVTLSGNACFSDVSAVRRFVEDNNLGKCEVKLSFG